MHLCKRDGKLIYSSMKKVNQCLVRWDWDINHVLTGICVVCHGNLVLQTNQRNSVCRTYSKMKSKSRQKRKNIEKIFRTLLNIKSSFFYQIKFFVSIFLYGITCYQYPINVSASIQHSALSWCEYILSNHIIYIPHAIASLTNFVHTGTPSLPSSLRVYFSCCFFFQVFVRLRFLFFDFHWER